MSASFPAPFGRYLLLEKIASGGMAEIFQAKLIGVEGFEKTVVIKRIHPFWSERRDFIAMLVDEAKLLVHLNHPNIVQVFELGREGNTYFIAMEYVEGFDLRHLLQRLKALRRPLPQEIGVALILETLKGLHYAHRRSLKGRGPLGIVHRDVSPQNILIGWEGEVKVTDFGIAKALIQTHETQTGVLKGKYAYMSPEQAAGAALDARSDLFSCGIVLYELLFEQRLFAGQNDLETLEKVRQAEVVWPEDKASGLLAGLTEVLKRALRRNPEDRFADAEAFEEALAACVPPERRAGRREISRFIGEVFAAEIQSRRQQAQELSHRTEGFLRKTRVTPKSAEDTVSGFETPTVPELPPPAPDIPKTNSNRGKNMGMLLAALLLLIPPAYYLLQREKHKLEIAQPVASSPLAVESPAKVARSPESETTESVPISGQPSPPSAFRLSLQAFPASALMIVQYPGGSRQGSGILEIPDLPPGSRVQASASLNNYEPQTRSWTVSSDPASQQYVFNLEKKNPAWGNIQVNAEPWGRVTMTGYISGSETPVARSRIPEGKYLVTVRNPALQKTLTATAVLRSGKTTNCHADFAGPGGMTCR